jgi:hypothetical protein
MIGVKRRERGKKVINYREREREKNGCSREREWQKIYLTI